jgi:hypothetical protein
VGGRVRRCGGDGANSLAWHDGRWGNGHGGAGTRSWGIGWQGGEGPPQREGLISVRERPGLGSCNSICGGESQRAQAKSWFCGQLAFEATHAPRMPPGREDRTLFADYCWAGDGTRALKTRLGVLFWTLAASLKGWRQWLTHLASRRGGTSRSRFGCFLLRCGGLARTRGRIMAWRRLGVSCEEVGGARTSHPASEGRAATVRMVCSWQKGTISTYGGRG